MALPVVHYLVYRAEDVNAVDWEEPDGGFVIFATEAHRAREIAAQRYHRGPHEKLVVAVADTPEDCWKAVVLAAHWEKERQEFRELMEVA